VEVALFDMAVLLQIFLDIITTVLYSSTDALRVAVMCLVVGAAAVGLGE